MIKIKSHTQHLFYLSLFIFISCLSHGQSATVEARIIDDKTQEPLPFATIKLMKGETVVNGLVSNAEGDFQFPASYLSSIDWAVISSIGYVNKIIPVNQFSVDKLNVIRIKESITQLKEVVVTPHKQQKLTASKIVRLAINAISKNYPQHPYSYTAYYRDYQKEGKEYVNMNEAAVGVFDKGFNTNDYWDTQIKLYQFKSNRDFKIDSLAAIPYDNNAAGNKFIPSAMVGSFGGNELSLLRIHDAIRNHDVQTYSFVNIFDTDFIPNHAFRLVDTIYRDNIPLYHITFQSFYFAYGRNFIAKGEIFIEQDNYAIHKLTYSTYAKEIHGESLTYNIQLEYIRKNELMYLNYISVNNVFKAKSINKAFKATKAIYDREINAFIITFNHTPEKLSALSIKNYSFTYNKKPFILNRVQLSPSKNVATVYVDNGGDFDWNEPASVLSQKLKVSFKNIKDMDGNLIVHQLNETGYDYRMMNQFRELFVQKVDESQPKFEGSFALKNIPMNRNQIDSTQSDFLFWSNTPLKNLFESTSSQQKPSRSPVDNFLRMQEKIYVQTDKPYYYPGEKLWFSAYVNYRDTTIQDSLSRVLYVELINTNGQIKNLKIIPIDNGIGFGNFTLADSMKIGNYFLRAYTNWMLNYPSGEIFIKPLKVLNVYQRPEKSSAEKTDTTWIKLKSSKQKYKPREEIRLQIVLHDENGEPATGNFSVSVTDMNQVERLPDEKNILTDYPFKQEVKQNSVDSLKPIEWGITLNGSYLTKNNKPIAAELMLVVSDKKKVKDYFSIYSNEEGKIWYNGFRLYDSAEIGLKERGENKPKGKIKLTRRTIPEFHLPQNDWDYSVTSETNDQRPELLEAGIIRGILLKDVIVTAPRYKDRIEDPIYGRVDYSVSSDDLSKFLRISDALQSRVPGFSSSAMAFITPISFTQGANKPVLIIDGVRMDGMNVDDLTPNLIERINVFKNGASIFGASGAAGVIVMYTKKSQYTKEKMEQSKIDLTSFQTFTISGFSSADQFYSPDYSTNFADKKHDYRSTIFWSPHVVPNRETETASLSFYSADSPTRYRIVVEGVTSKFIPVRSVIYVDVEN